MSAGFFRFAALSALGLVLFVLFPLLIGALVPGLTRPLGPVERGGTALADRPQVSADRPGSFPVLVIAGPIHTDIALPATPMVREHFGFLEEDGLPIERPEIGWVIAGWGGRSFYVETPTFADIRPWPLLKSFLGDRSVMRVELAGTIAPDPERIRTFTMTGEQLTALVNVIGKSFMRGTGLRPTVVPGAGYGAMDRFYEGADPFNALIGCNVWTATMLRSAGVTTGFWTPIPATLFWSIDLYG